MKRDKKLISKLKQHAYRVREAELKTIKTAQLLQPPTQQQVEILDQEKPLLKYSQQQLLSELPLENVQNIFKLDLNHGPYRMNVNPQTVYLAGHNGHIASFNWRHKQIESEFDVKEKCRDITGIAQRNYAVAQKNSVYIYDPKGVELHKLRMSNHVEFLNYLPYHYLLASLSNFGQLVYQDITQGKIVVTYNTTPSPKCLSQNPNTGILAIGDALGVVRMYSPNTGTPLSQLLCHRGAVSAQGFSADGNYLVTGGSEGLVKVWDLRTHKLMDSQLRIPSLISALSVSEKGIIGVGFKDQVMLFKDCLKSDNQKPYMRHKTKGMVNQIQFIKHEDYLAIATFDGYESIVVPESGEPFYDTYEQQDFQNKKQRLESNVRSLVERLPPDSITLYPSKIGTIDRVSKDVIEKERKILQEQQATKKILKKKHKMRGRNKGNKKEIIKQQQKETEKSIKWQGMLSDTLRIKRAEKEKRKEELGLLSRIEQISAKEFIKAVK